MIPRLIHFVWIGPPQPAWVKRNIEQFRKLNPDHEILIHGEDVLLECYRRLYEHTAKPPDGFAQRADLLRLSILKKWGGWYFDTDFWPLRPISDLVRAYNLDGRRLVCSEQHGQKNTKLRVTNAILAGNPDAEAFNLIDDSLSKMPDRPGKLALGPGIFSRLVGQRADLFKLLRWPWFFPAAIGEAVCCYDRIIAGDSPVDVFWDKLHDTSGQLPFGMHLWAGGARRLPGSGPAIRGSTPTISLEGRNVGLVATSRQWGDATQPFHSIAQGFERLGCSVRVQQPRAWPVFDAAFDPSIIVMWNGRKSRYIGINAGARAAGKISLVAEHGFFDRRKYTQLDHQGILHWSSWAGKTTRKAPPAGAARLDAVWPSGTQEFGSRPDGYVLLLGQVDGDSQLDESEIKKRSALIQLVSAALPAGVEAQFRPHPNRARHTPSTKRHMPICKAGSLKEAVAGARFVITINSNAGHECLAMGCPVLAFGPALYLRAGLARPATRDGLAQQIQFMLDGCRPSRVAVRNYLENIACRQYSDAEFESGAPQLKVIAEAATRKSTAEAIA